MNFSDSERMASFLDDLGYAETAKRAEASLVIINTCGIKQTSESRIYGLVPQIKKENALAKVVVTGCVSGRKDVQRRLKQVDLWLPIKDMTKLAEFLESGKTGLPDSYLKIEPKYISKISAQVPIGTGCDNFCSYCVVPYARGRETYRAAREIIAEVETLVSRGYKEINLVAQNVNSYKDGEFGFARLLKMVNDIPGDFWIRFMSSHPKDMSEELIEAVARCPKVCRHIHLPVQAGNNEILERMNRKYTVEHYKKLLDQIRSHLPEASITTDIIVGFPGETEEQFDDTAELVKLAKFDNVYLGKYSPRPNTASAKLKDDVSQVEKKRREDVIMKIVRTTASESHQKYLGKTVLVLAEEKNKGHYYGHTNDNTFVKITTANMNDDLAGRFIKVKITEARDFGMDGEVIYE